MAQTLLLGLGGTGSRVVSYVVQELRKKNIGINDGEIACAVLDTNTNDQDKLRENGAGVPIISISKNRTVGDYINLYASRGVKDWMPESDNLRTAPMTDGASQMRVKSRLGFMDTVQDGSIRELENVISALFNRGTTGKVRVMVVSSLSGGTGAGMFIQVGLWLRQFFKRRNQTCSIRGIFLLPDIFVDNTEIGDDPTEVQSLYANAYGSIRELNALNKIKVKGYRPLRQVKIDTLFDSETEEGIGRGNPVYDYSFFIDEISETGSVLKDIVEYEKVTARLVYMQIFAPINKDMVSEEDNLFKRFELSKEPVYGSCGTAKAIYPTDDVVRYCALRALKDSLNLGWKRIDDEIKAKIDKENEKEKSGVTLKSRLDPAAEYVRLFDAKRSRTDDQTGNDRLFNDIQYDVENDYFEKDGDEITVDHKDKVEEFVKMLDTIVAERVDTKDPGGIGGFKLPKGWEEKALDKSKLTDIVISKSKYIVRLLDGIDSSVDDISSELADEICPNDVSDLNQDNLQSVYGMFTKKDRGGNTVFVHPIAVRYMLYKLSKALDDLRGEFILDDMKADAENGFSRERPKVSFDNPKTRTVEEDAISYLTSKEPLTGKDKWLSYFKKQYVQFNGAQHELARTYAIASVKVSLATKLIERLNGLIEVAEAFFKNLSKVSNTIDKALGDNIEKNEAGAKGIIYVCATEEDKEGMYEDLGLKTELSNSDANINRIVVSALYKKFCANDNPASEKNKPYINSSVETTFFKEVVASNIKAITRKHAEEIDMDIYTAVCKSSDIEYAKAHTDDIDEVGMDSDILDIDTDTMEYLKDNQVELRHKDAMKDLIRRLITLSAPMLISGGDQEDDPDEISVDLSDTPFPETKTPIKKRKRFWGFNPALVESCPYLGELLRINVDLQKNKAYARNEIDCYRAVYGIQAGYIEKFNELRYGEYYRAYSNVVNMMSREQENGNDTALIHTPHLDKTWHLFLPYITADKQKEADEKFYRAFILSVAYGFIRLDPSGKYYQIKKLQKNATKPYDMFETVIGQRGEPVGKVEILELISALRTDPTFMIDVSHRVEKIFRDEYEGYDTYEGTEFLRGNKGEGGLANKGELNIVTMIVRYRKSRNADSDTEYMLADTVYELCKELVKHNYDAEEVKKVENTALELCNRIYKASAMKEKSGLESLKLWCAGTDDETDTDPAEN